MHAGISFEAEMTRDQADRLARLMAEGRPTRPAGVLSATLKYPRGPGATRRRLARPRYARPLPLGAPVPRGTELMRKIGLEPEVETFDVLELG